MDIHLILIVLAAFLGGVGLALFGWAGSVPKEPFDARKFLVSVGTAAVAGLAYGIYLYSPSSSFTRDILGALSAGITGDIVWNRVSGAIQASAVNKLTPPAAPTVTVTAGTSTQTPVSVSPVSGIKVTADQAPPVSPDTALNPNATK